jgi:hypothetical protein
MSKASDIQALQDKLISRGVDPSEAAALAVKWLTPPEPVKKATKKPVKKVTKKKVARKKVANKKATGK